MPIITITHEVDDESIMDNVFYGIFRGSSSWVYRFNYGSYELNPEVGVWYEAEDGKTRRKFVTAEMLALAYGQLIEQGQHHCGEPITFDDDCWDACVSDMVLQQAIFGKIIYG